MARIQLFEFNETSKCPKFIRDCLVETLGNGLRWGKIYDSLGSIFVEFCKSAKADKVLDLCSGSGEPVSILIDALQKNGETPPKFFISDLFPNVPVMEKIASRYNNLIEIIKEPLDATDVPDKYDCKVRTIISAFHHFPPKIASNILEDCVKKRKGIFIVEAFPRNIMRFIPIFFPLAAASLANPFITEKEKLSKFIFTYALPIIPLFGIWDAVVSVFRIHSKDELFNMVKPFKDSFSWYYDEIPYLLGGRNLIFFGLPK